MEDMINQSKKRKTETLNDTVSLTQQDALKILQPLTKDQLISILQTLITHDVAALSAVRSIADTDPSHHKLFIRGIGWDTTTATLKSVFEQYGEVEEGVVIVDKALVEPSKKIDGRITVTQLASAKDSTASNVDGRKVYVGNVPWEVRSERLLECFAAFGEIEEGPLRFDKQSGRDKGFAFFVYKSEEGARRAVVDSVKSIDGHQVMCKMAVDGKKGRAGGGVMSPRGPVPGIGGRTSIVVIQLASLLPHQNSTSGTGSGPGYVTCNGYPAGTGYNNGGYASAVAAATPEYPGQNSYRPLMNRLPPIQGGFADSGNYGPSSGYPTQPNMPSASPRGPHSGMYQVAGRVYESLLDENALNGCADFVIAVNG
ncbi:UBP1-associated protein 2C-like protein [Tanacetum coccineum]|uniref:UBP1-associated protein 2C-like protein n=1 Tax=Tanacetum coccineum TaxID=301880 RepID=A0ABQ5B4M2_9ASTR